jgi:hypothetical protein
VARRSVAVGRRHHARRSLLTSSGGGRAAKVAGTLGNLGQAILLVLLIPVAIIAIGLPVVLFVRLLIEIGGRL